MIPKIIHYCWFGDNPLSELAEHCIESWKKYCPDYEIKRWDEQSIDVDSVSYMREAYEEHAWGFVPDVARLQIIYKYGGIYLDTDVELLKPLDELLENEAFAGFEDAAHVALGLGFGAVPGMQVIKDMLDDYQNYHFRMENGELNRMASPIIQTNFLIKKGLVTNNQVQKVAGMNIYSTEFFCPESYETGKLSLTDNTYSIHHYAGSWLTEEEQKWDLKRRKVIKLFGERIGRLVWAGARFLRKSRMVGVRTAICLTWKHCFVREK